MSDANDTLPNLEAYENKKLPDKSQYIELLSQTSKAESLKPVQEQPNAFVQKMMRERVTSISHRRAAFPMLYHYMKKMNMSVDPEVALSVEASNQHINAETVSTPAVNQHTNTETVSTLSSNRRINPTAVSTPSSNLCINAITVSTPSSSHLINATTVPTPSSIEHINATTVSTPSSNEHINAESVPIPKSMHLVNTESFSTSATRESSNCLGFRFLNLTSDVMYERTAQYNELKRKSFRFMDQHEKHDVCNPENLTLSILQRKELFERNAPIHLHRKEKFNLFNGLRTDNPVYGFPDFCSTEKFSKACLKQSIENYNEQEREHIDCSDVWISLREASKSYDKENGNYVPAGVIMGPYLQAFAKKTRHMPY